MAFEEFIKAVLYFCGCCRLVFCTVLQAGAVGRWWVRFYGERGTREKCLSISRFSRKKKSFCLQGGRGKVLATLKPKNSYRM